jgi:hypothetical protein
MSVAERRGRGECVPEEVDSRQLKVEREEKTSPGGGTRERHRRGSRFGKLVNRMTTPPPVFAQGCDSK